MDWSSLQLLLVEVIDPHVVLLGFLHVPSLSLPAIGHHWEEKFQGFTKGWGVQTIIKSFLGNERKCWRLEIEEVLNLGGGEVHVDCGEGLDVSICLNNFWTHLVNMQAG